VLSAPQLRRGQSGKQEQLEESIQEEKSTQIKIYAYILPAVGIGRRPIA
jgi:hypothetical protein